MPGYDDEYDRYAQGRQKTKGPNPLVFIICVIAAIWFFTNYGNVPNGESNTVIDNPTVSTPLSETYVVRVYETEVDKQPPWLIKLLNNRFWNEWLIEDKGSRYVTFDPDNDQSKSFIAAGEKLGKSMPFIIHAKDGGQVIQIIELREGVSTETIRQKLEEAVN